MTDLLRDIPEPMPVTTWFDEVAELETTVNPFGPVGTNSSVEIQGWKKKKHRKPLIYKLKVTPEIKEALADILKAQFEMRIKSTLSWSCGSYRTWEDFRNKKMMEPNASDLSLLRKIYTPEQIDEYLNTFITIYASAKEKYDNEQRERQLKRAKPTIELPAD